MNFEWIRHWLPSQGPLKEFVHHNTLHAFENFPFEEACARAARLYGSRTFLPLKEYRRLYQEDQISAESLLVQAGGDPNLRDQLLYAEVDDPLFPGLAQEGLRSRWSQRGLTLDRWTHPVLFRLLSQFLDQGVALWPMPGRHSSFFESVRALVKNSWLPLAPFSSKSLERFWDMQPEQICREILHRFLGRPEAYQGYLLEMCLAHPGWSSMVAVLQSQPQQLVSPRSISLEQMCALELMAEWAFVEQKWGSQWSPLLTEGECLASLPCSEDWKWQPTPSEQLGRLWQRALEESYSRGLVLSISGQPAGLPKEGPQAQAFFCIDDRECSLRRHLETVNPAVETFGTAGFFGIDCLFQGSADAFPFKQCPVPIVPQHLICEEEVSPSGGSALASKAWHYSEADPSTNLLWRGFLVSQLLGLGSALKLAWALLKPSLGPLTVSSLRRVDTKAKLKIHRQESECSGGLWVGYSDQEMADRVSAVLSSTGAWKSGLAPLVVFVGHGASSVNNPYFAAYDCGACSGKPGAPNARAFALMANRAEVRRLLAERGTPIAETTWFVGALHDTTRDEIQYYETEQIPQPLLPLFGRFQKDLAEALAKNAQERCAKFPQVAASFTPSQALAEVARRSTALFETRPELNHATNAACIVGPRRLTRGIHLDRRVFLNSYEAETDPEGQTLAQILSAVVPVCGGINLEYYFSRLDPSVYGAGSKLPHNVNGLIGVMNGVDGDLLCGLPTQMTEFHTPVRLSLLVYQSPEVALQAASQRACVWEFIRRGWLRYFCMRPSDHQVFLLENGSMRPYLESRELARC
jgi:uncharacterized protein YbcC (UPF0753/DUF2309 family)